MCNTNLKSIFMIILKFVNIVTAEVRRIDMKAALKNVFDSAVAGVTNPYNGRCFWNVNVHYKGIRMGIYHGH